MKTTINAAAASRSPSSKPRRSNVFVSIVIDVADVGVWFTLGSPAVRSVA